MGVGDKESKIEHDIARMGFLARAAVLVPLVMGHHSKTLISIQIWENNGIEKRYVVGGTSAKVKHFQMYAVHISADPKDRNSQRDDAWIQFLQSSQSHFIHDPPYLKGGSTLNFVAGAIGRRGTVDFMQNIVSEGWSVLKWMYVIR